MAATPQRCFGNLGASAGRLAAGAPLDWNAPPKPLLRCNGVESETQGMGPVVIEEARDDLLERGYSRRQLAGIAAVFGIGAVAAASAGRPAWASGGHPDPAPTAKVRIGANECWTGPFAPGQAAAMAMVPHSNRYEPHDARGDFIKAVVKVEGVPENYVAPWPGSSDPLSRSVVTFCWRPIRTRAFTTSAHPTTRPAPSRPWRTSSGWWPTSRRARSC